MVILNVVRTIGITEVLGYPYALFYFRGNLPFPHAHNLQNPWNENKRVQIARDGQVRGCLQ